MDRDAANLKLLTSSHTALVMFDAILTLCEGHIRGASTSNATTRRDLASIMRIAKRQRGHQLDIMDTAEALLKQSLNGREKQP